MSKREVIVAAKAGFCFGVERATEAVGKAMREKQETNSRVRLFTLGQLIHNKDYTERLEAGGVHIATSDQLETLAAEATEKEPVRVFVRAHGMTAGTERLLRHLHGQNPHFSFVDCTCSFVKNIHRIVANQETERRAAQERNGTDDRFLLVLGSAVHPEVEGFLSRFSGEVHVFGCASELEALMTSGTLPKDGEKLPILIAQTTQNLGEWEKSKKLLENHYTKPVIFDTICSITETRQKEAADLAGKCDYMVVIGGRNSSNSAKLYTICKSICADTVWVERASDLPERRPFPCQKVGVVAGASTPRDIIEEVANNMSENQNESKSFEELLSEQSIKTINTGDTVEGTITAISTGEIQLDIGAKVTGVVKLDQITDDPNAKLDEMFHDGDKVKAFVIRVSDKEGVAELSIKRVNADENWQKIVEAYDTQENVEAKVIGVNKGGLEALLYNNRIFIPAAHSGIPRGGDLSVLVGQNVTMRVLEIGDRKRAKGSIRLVLRDEKRAREKEFWENIEEGKIYTGVVKSLTSYGAFVDLGGVDGMVHRSELSWKHIKSPADVVSVGQEVTVFVKSFDLERKRISLGYKTEATNPWYIFTHRYSIGDVAEVKIVSLVPFGAFAEIVEGVDGLIHISQIADHKIGTPADELQVGQTVEAKIIDIDSENQKVSLSIRALLEEKKAAEEAMPADEAVAEEAEEADSEQ